MTSRLPTLPIESGTSDGRLRVEPGHGLAAMNRTFGDLPETGLPE
jgi:hypothetical protein